MSEVAPLGRIDQGLIVLYLVALLAVGFSFLRRSREEEDYLLAGRRLSVGAFVATLVSTWYGGILAVGESGWLYGVAVIFMFGVPYYAASLVFALWLAPKIRASALYTIPDKVGQTYGRGAAMVAAVLCWLLTNPAPYVLMQATLLSLAFGLNHFPAMLIGLVLSTVYVYVGGFRADVRVNIVQFVLMFAAFVIIIPFCVVKLGGWSWLVAQIPAGHWQWNGGNSWQYMLAWWFIALWTLVEPSFHQRCYAARSPQVAQRGVLLSIVCWFTFDLMTLTTALYARAALPDLASPLMAFPVLGQRVLPTFMLGLFYVGMLATVMSTTVSYTFMSGVTFSRDIVWRLRGARAEESSERWTGWGLLLTSVIAVVMALVWPSVKDLWYNFGTAFVPGLLLPVAVSYTKLPKPGRGWMAGLMAASSGVALAWLLVGLRNAVDGWPVMPWGVEPIYPGLLVSVVGYLWGVARDRAARRRQDPVDE